MKAPFTLIFKCFMFRSLPLTTCSVSGVKVLFTFFFQTAITQKSQLPFCGWVRILPIIIPLAKKYHKNACDTLSGHLTSMVLV